MTMKQKSYNPVSVSPPLPLGRKAGRGKFRSGFTLIELLVVIAIVSLLVSILLPSLTKAKDLARKAVCMTNLRGFSLAVSMYAADKDGRVPWWRWTNYPPELWTGEGDTKDYSSLGLLVRDRYADAHKSFLCPGETHPLDADGLYRVDGVACGSYTYLSNIPHPRHPMGAAHSESLGWHWPDRKLDSAPANAAFFVDITSLGGDLYFQNSLHSAGANVLYVGGNVRGIPRDCYENTTVMWPSGWDWNVFNDGDVKNIDPDTYWYPSFPGSNF